MKSPYRITHMLVAAALSIASFAALSQPDPDEARYQHKTMAVGVHSLLPSISYAGTIPGAGLVKTAAATGPNLGAFDFGITTLSPYTQGIWFRPFHDVLIGAPANANGHVIRTYKMAATGPNVSGWDYLPANRPAIHTVKLPLMVWYRKADNQRAILSYPGVVTNI